MSKKTKIIVAVTNDLATDQRADKICNSLVDWGYEVVLVGRRLRKSPKVKRKYKTKRFRLLFNKGPLFYATFNFRLANYLTYSSAKVIISCDLDTLSACWRAGFVTGTNVIFDSHEYFTEVPELIGRPRVKRYWKRLERKYVPQTQFRMTVCESIADLYKAEYGTEFKVLRNVPLLNKPEVEVENIRPEGKKVIIYQGAINVYRGIENMVDAMQYIDDAVLCLFGDGDVREAIKNRIESKGLSDKVIMKGRVPLEQLHGYTRQADLGLSLEEDKGMNYRYALPNKLFDYIHAEIPVLVSELHEMKKIVDQYKVGNTIDSTDPKLIADKIIEMLSNPGAINQWKSNAKLAKEELCWEKEQQVLKQILLG